LTFTHHEIFDALRLAGISRYRATPGRQAATSISLHQTLVSASQMRPLWSPHGQGTPYSPDRGPPRPTPTHDPQVPIRCELCLEIFRFYSHDTAW
jgi:hypothetical protein